MRYIKKVKIPNSFGVTQNLILWEEFKNPHKKITHKYILKCEQKNLCAYCEVEIKNLKDDSHLEHIKPQEKNPQNRFDYYNLIVSCEGNCRSDLVIQTNRKQNSCGHKKADKFNEKLFLNPIEIENLSEYFIFNRDGEIKPNSKDYERANETIKVLNLNSKRLQIERENELQAFDEYLLNLDENEAIMFLNETLNLNQKSLPSFITFLRYIHKDLLNA